MSVRADPGFEFRGPSGAPKTQELRRRLPYRMTKLA